MSDPSPSWFYAKGSEKFGPFHHSQLVELAQNGDLDPRLDLVWGPGLPDWVPAGEVDGFFEKRAPLPVSEAPPQSGASPNAGPWDGVPDYDDASVPLVQYPGSGRFAYFFTLAVAIPLVVFGSVIFSPQLSEWVGAPIAAALPVVLALLLSLVITLSRFANLGMSRWWLLGQMIPLVNIWLGYRLFACPPGYATARKMDGVGIFLAIIYWLSFLGAVALLVLLAIGGVIGDQDPAKLEEFIQRIEEAIRSARSE